MDIDSGKPSTSGFVFLDCPQSMKMDSSNASLVGAISDYFLSLSNGWDLTTYLKSLSKTLKALKLGFSMPTNPKEGTGGSCMVSNDFSLVALWKYVVKSRSPYYVQYYVGVVYQFFYYNSVISLVYSRLIILS